MNLHGFTDLPITDVIPIYIMDKSKVHLMGEGIFPLFGTVKSWGGFEQAERRRCSFAVLIS